VSRGIPPAPPVYRGSCAISTAERGEFGGWPDPVV